MKKIIMYLFCMVLFVGCTQQKTEKSQNKKQDFWLATLQAIENDLDGNTYDNGKWSIGVEDISMATDPDHRSIVIRQIFTTDLQKNTVMFSLQNDNQQKTVSYIYKQEENQNVYQLEIESYDENYQKYHMIYTENYEEKAKGELAVSQKQISFDNLPLLNEANQAWQKLLDDYQKEFDINYSQYQDFIPVPQLIDQQGIPDVISDDVYATMFYYSDVYTNARGYTLQTFLEVQNDYSQVKLGVYNLDRKSNDEMMTYTLEKRSENCYNMTSNKDLDEYFAVYFQDNIAYIYLQDKSDQEIKNDVKNNQGNQARYALTLDINR